MSETKAKIKSVNSQGQKELDKAEQQFDTFQENIKEMTMDRINSEAKENEVEPQTKLSKKELDKSKDVYLKPQKVILSRDKFNERFRESYNFSKEYVQFIAENKEIIGEGIEIWTRPYPGLPAEFWKVPVNKPVWGPRYLAEQIRRKFYHRLVMQQNTITESNHIGSIYGAIAVESKIARLTAEPVNSSKSVFMGASSF